MLISKAHAQAVEAPIATTTTASAGVALPPPEAPSAMEAFVWNMGLVVMLVAMFYVLLIRPQQRRFKEHSEMLRGLKKGDKVVTGGGLVGTIEKISDGEDEVIVDLGNGLKVTALREMIQKRSVIDRKDSKAAEKK